MDLSVKEKTALINIVAGMRENIDAMRVTRAYNSTVVNKIDWHLTAYYLDELARKGIVNLVGHDASGHCVYKLAAGSKKEE